MKFLGLSVLALGLISQAIATPVVPVRGVTIVERADNPLQALQVTIDSAAQTIGADLQAICMIF
jgi:hypothetical protein